MTTLYTVGHSQRTLDDLMSLLHAAGIATLVDVRRRPQSARYPHFNEDSLRAAATAAGMQYHWAGRQLGGQRAPLAGSPHRALGDDGLRGYADYMDQDAFAKAAAQLIGLARRAPTAILCAERDPLHCHRSLIADYLTLQGIEVIHLLDAGVSRPHALRPEARRESARLVYDRHTSGELPLGQDEGSLATEAHGNTRTRQ
ncbi:MAG: DUF488 domain-containing protein [Gammaproteobacteria bacterium]|jgi:uncharacterized protein (DUF488 family)|nr:DUF488 domain-containing protein [Gammaproteobacteria bacterium]